MKAKTVDLRETKNLNGRLVVRTQRSRSTVQRYRIRSCQFSLTITALFAPSGSKLHRNDKSKLI